MGWLSRIRFNLLDMVGSSSCAIAASRGQWGTFIVAALIFTALSVSIFAEDTTP